MNSLREISLALAGIKDARTIERFLVAILTRSEIRQIGSRWELVKLLNQGISQRTIARKLGLSLCKITRGSRELRKRDSAFSKVIGRLPPPAGRP